MQHPPGMQETSSNESGDNRTHLLCRSNRPASSGMDLMRISGQVAKLFRCSWSSLMDAPFFLVLLRNTPVTN